MVMMTWLADVLRDAGLKVEESAGWKTRGNGEMGTVRGILAHHTAGPATGDRPSLNLVLNGRPDLEGPLSQLFLTRAGVFVVLAAGRCNHAGAGSWQGVTAGNSSFIGIEAENMGTKADPWPAVQMDAYVRGCAAILRHLGEDDVMVAGHKEYALPRGRKIDPLFDMIDFRAHVEHAMAGGADKPLSAVTVAIEDPRRSMLCKGDQGEDVKDLQSMLNRWLERNAGAQIVAKIPTMKIDGAFGPATQGVVKLVQAKAGLLQDGLVGPATWKALLA